MKLQVSLIVAALLLVVQSSADAQQPRKQPMYKGKTFEHWKAAVREYVVYVDTCWWAGVFNTLDAWTHEPVILEKLRLVRNGKWKVDDPLPTKTNEDSLPLLNELLKDRHRQVRAYAADRLSTFGPKAKPAVPLLVGMLQQEDEYIKLTAASTLGLLGLASAWPPTADAEFRDWLAMQSVPKLLAILKDNKRGYKVIHTRQAAARALQWIAPDVAKTVRQLMNPQLSDVDYAEFEKRIGVPPAK